jgi:hypothetical protein
MLSKQIQWQTFVNNSSATNICRSKQSNRGAPATIIGCRFFWVCLPRLLTAVVKIAPPSYSASRYTKSLPGPSRQSSASCRVCNWLHGLPVPAAPIAMIELRLTIDIAQRLYRLQLFQCAVRLGISSRNLGDTVILRNFGRRKALRRYNIGRVR